MPDIDPLALTRTEPLQTSLNPSSLSLSKSNGGSTLAPAAKATKTVNTGSQRIDLEPIYTSLKAAVGENWGIYKTAIGKFVLGELNQSELCFRISHLIGNTEIEHLHNSLIIGIYTNAFREPPEPGVVAPWVSAHDKTSNGIGGTGGIGKGGDKVEERLRREVMSLPVRDRRRLKEVGDRDPYNAPGQITATQMAEFRIARSIKLPDTVPASAGGLSKTNWDIEIRRRYGYPLSYETGEFPEESTIANRMLPICYEEALPSGPAEQCAEFIATATEMYMKSVVGSILSLTRSNIIAAGAKGGGVFTWGFKQRRKSRDSNIDPGNFMLQRPLAIGDLRFALGVGGCELGTMPDIISDVLSGWPEGVLEGWETYCEEENEMDVDLDISDPERRHQKYSVLSGVPDHAITNGDAGRSNGHTYSSARPEAKGINSRQRPIYNEPGVEAWTGSSGKDRTKLFRVLDECLAIGS